MGRVTAPFAACGVVEGLVPAADLRNVELLDVIGNESGIYIAF